MLLPLLLIDKYFPITAASQLLGVSLVVILAVSILLYTARNYEGTVSRKQILAAINDGQAELLHVKTTRAVERVDPEDFGAAFYLEVEVDGTPKLLYLQGQYLDELAWKEAFPSTEFVLIRRADTREIINLQIEGQYLKPERVLPAFPKARWQAGAVPEDGSLLAGRLTELTE